jgi:hypothetical protein
MREPIDYDSELKTLDERARELKLRKLQQLGELVVATGADTLPPEILAGALLGAADAKNAAVWEGWRTRGAAFFHRPKRTAKGAPAPPATGAPGASGTLSLGGEAGTAG